MAYNEKFDWGIYNGIGITYDYKDKSLNVRRQIHYMLNRSLLMFKYHGLPDSLPAKELERLLQTNGYAGVTEVEGDLYAFYGGLGGEPNVYGKPTTMTIANPALNYNEMLEIGEEVVLAKNDDLMMGLVPIYSKYSTLMNENEITMILSLINKRANNMISVTDDNTAESARQYLKNLEAGDLGYIFENKLFDSLKTNPTGEGSGTNLNELVEFEQYVKASMYNEIGLNANFNMKRERLVSDELEANSETLYPLVDNMLDNRRQAVEQINEMFGTEIQVEFNSSWDMRLGQEEYTEASDETREEELNPETDLGLEDITSEENESPQGEDVENDLNLNDEGITEDTEALEYLHTLEPEESEEDTETDSEDEQEVTDTENDEETAYPSEDSTEPLNESDEDVEEPTEEPQGENTNIDIDINVDSQSEATEEPENDLEEENEETPEEDTEELTEDSEDDSEEEVNVEVNVNTEENTEEPEEEDEDEEGDEQLSD